MKRLVILLVCLTASFVALADSEAYDYLYLAPVAHVAGGSFTFWTSDLTIFNPGGNDVKVRLAFNGSVLFDEWNGEVPGRSQIFLPDVLASTFRLETEDVGAIVVRSTGRVDVTVRTFSTGAESCDGIAESYGQSYSGVSPDDALPGTRLGFLGGLRSDGSFRSNIELLNAGENVANVEIRFFDDFGIQIGEAVTREVQPQRRVGVSAALPGGYTSAYAELRLDSSDAKLIAFASVVDGSSGDPTTIPLTLGPAVEQPAFSGSHLEGDWRIREELVSETTPVVCGQTVNESRTLEEYTISLWVPRFSNGRIWSAGARSIVSTAGCRVTRSSSRSASTVARSTGAAAHSSRMTTSGNTRGWWRAKS